MAMIPSALCFSSILDGPRDQGERGGNYADLRIGPRHLRREKFLGGSIPRGLESPLSEDGR